MHMCWLGGHFDAEYTPSEYLRRGAKASLSAIRLPSCRKTASVSVASRSPRPRTRSDPCSATKARSALRCSDAQRAASPVASTRRIGGLPGCRSTLSSKVGDEDVIAALRFPERQAYRYARSDRLARTVEPPGRAPPARRGDRSAPPDRRGSGDR